MQLKASNGICEYLKPESQPDQKKDLQAYSQTSQDILHFSNPYAKSKNSPICRPDEIFNSWQINKDLIVGGCHPKIKDNEKCPDSPAGSQAESKIRYRDNEGNLLCDLYCDEHASGVCPSGSECYNSHCLYKQQDPQPKPSPPATHFENPFAKSRTDPSCESDESYQTDKIIKAGGCFPKKTTENCPDAPKGSSAKSTPFTTKEGDNLCFLVCAGEATGTCPPDSKCLAPQDKDFIDMQSQAINDSSICLYQQPKKALLIS